MAINLDELFGNEAFRTVDPDRLKIFRNFAREIEGKNMLEVLSIYAKFTKSLPPGKPVTEAEKAAIIRAVGESVPPADYGKFQAVLKLAEKFT
ncbi:MAG: hypothetical protein FWC55_06205 [Firmicutes bacterium]|nr:hypothetical protein [Bacillota bacterium]